MIERHTIPSAAAEPVKQREDPDYSRYRDSPDALHGAPYEAGDVVWVQHIGRIRKALIVRVGVRPISFGRSRMPQYTARLQSLISDEWLELTRPIFPGDIKRGYGLAATAVEK